MTLRTIAGHSFDLDRLPEQPTVLDVGCRGFDFTSGILKLRPRGFVHAIDPDPNIVFSPEMSGCLFRNVALVGDRRKRARYAMMAGGDANFLTDEPTYYDATFTEVECVDIRDFEQRKWSLVKLDCEGSEFAILEHWPGPIADQISVEFHDYNRPQIRDGAYYETLFEVLGRFGYRVLRHEITDISGRGARGHWDTVLALEA